MRKISGLNKKGLSEVVAYVLLIVIAISISIFVYSWIKSYLPKESTECPEDISLIVKEYFCKQTAKELNLTLQNKGLFDIDGFLIKVSNESEKNPIYNLNLTTGMEKGIVYFRKYTSNGKALHPGDNFNGLFNYKEYSKIFKIQIIPFKKYKEKLLLCGKSEITQNLEGCS